MLVTGGGPNVSGRYHAWHPPRAGAPRDQAPGVQTHGHAGKAGNVPICPIAAEHPAKLVDIQGIRPTLIARVVADYCSQSALRTSVTEPNSSDVDPQQQGRSQRGDYDDWVDSDNHDDQDSPDSIEPSTPHDTSRSKLLSRAITVLIAERQRSGEPLRQESVERVYAQLKLTPDEMLLVGHEARSIGLMDPEEPEGLDELAFDSDGDEGQATRSDLLDRILSHGLLGADRERQLGRAVQVAKKLEAQALENELPANDDLHRELARGRQARQALVLANVRLAMDIARRYAHDGLELDDLLQEGIIGLLRASESFEPELGFRFTTYATWWIRQSIMRAIANTGRPIRLPVHRVDQLKALRRTVRRLQAKDTQARVTPKQIADELGWTLEAVGKLLVIDAEIFTSLHPVDDDGPSVLDQLVSPDPTPEAAAITFDFQELVAECVAALPKRDADVLRLRFGLHGRQPLTLEEIGKQYKLTRERIRQIESKCLRQLRRPTSKMIKHGREFLDE